MGRSICLDRLYFFYVKGYIVLEGGWVDGVV